jgi:predicted nucleic acid-binding protein
MTVFIDSNIPMYVAGAEHPNRKPAHRFLKQVERGEIEGCTSTAILQEIQYRYSSLRRRDLVRDVYDFFVEVCPAVLAVTLAETDRARDLLLDLKGLSARVAIHAAVMMNHDVEWIASFDQGFDGVPGIRRHQLS